MSLSTSSCSHSLHSRTILHKNFQVSLVFDLEFVICSPIRDCFQNNCVHTWLSHIFHICRALYIEKHMFSTWDETAYFRMAQCKKLTTENQNKSMKMKENGMIIYLNQTMCDFVDGCSRNQVLKFLV